MGITNQAFRTGNSFVNISIRTGLTLRTRLAMLAEVLELVTSPTTIPFETWYVNGCFFFYYRLDAFNSRDDEIIFYLVLAWKVRQVHCVWSQFLYSPNLYDFRNNKCHFFNGHQTVASFFVPSELRSDLASEKFKRLKARLLGNFKFIKH